METPVEWPPMLWPSPDLQDTQPIPVVAWEAVELEEWWEYVPADEVRHPETCRSLRVPVIVAFVILAFGATRAGIQLAPLML